MPTSMGAICQTCGGNGWKELLATCTRCCLVCEHCYCMRDHAYEAPRHWVCSDCSMKPAQKNAVSNSINAGSNYQRDCERRIKARNESSKPVPKWKPIPDTARVKLLSPEETIRLSSGITKKGRTSSNMVPRPLPAGSAVGFTGKIVAGLRAEGLRSATVSRKANPSSLQFNPVEPPCQSASDFGSSVIKQAAEAPEVLEVINPNSGAVAIYHDSEEGCSSSLSHKLAQFLPYLPALHATWKGSFQDSGRRGEFYGEFWSQPASKTRQKAYKLSKVMPDSLKVELLPIGYYLNDLFENKKPDLCDVELYFFSDEKSTKRSKGKHTHLLEMMVSREAMIRSNINGTDLLIFSSRLLDKASQEIIWKQKKTNDFLWGIFLRAKSPQPPLPLLLPGTSYQNTTDVDNRGLIDMDNEVERDKNVSRSANASLAPKQLRESPKTPSKALKQEREISVPPGFERVLTTPKSKAASARAAISERITRESHVKPGLFWAPPSNKWVKLNVQGISKPESDLTGATGMVRDESGRWVCGYILKLKNMSETSAELWAIYQGLKLLWDRGFRKVVVETTSPTALEALNNHSSLLHKSNSILQRCKEMTLKNWECSVFSISAEQNSCAIWLAGKLEEQPMGLVVFEYPPRGLITLLEKDCTASALTQAQPQPQ